MLWDKDLFLLRIMPVPIEYERHLSVIQIDIPISLYKSQNKTQIIDLSLSIPWDGINDDNW